MPSEQLELVRRIFRGRVANQLHLVELVGSQNAPSVLARRSRLAAEAWRICDKSLGQHVGVDDLVAIEIRHWHFRGRNKKQVIDRYRIDVVLKFRELASARQCRPVDQNGRPNLLIAMLATVQLDEKVDQRPNEPRA